MSKSSIYFFGELLENESYEKKFNSKSGEVIVVRLFTSSSIIDSYFSKIEIILKKLDTAIDATKKLIIDSCQKSGDYEDKMQEYMEYTLIDCLGNNVSDFSSEFHKRFGEIAPSDFADRLKLRSIQFSMQHGTVVFDYYYTELVDEVWAVNYDFNLNLIDMTCES